MLTIVSSFFLNSVCYFFWYAVVKQTYTHTYFIYQM